MDAKNLRIGNLIARNYPSYYYITVKSYSSRTINSNLKHLFEPILLTDSFFQKLNAEKDKEYNAHYVLPINGDYGYMLFTKDESGYSVFIHIGDSSILLYHDIMYVHELQNLYFALTGEELTLKP